MSDEERPWDAVVLWRDINYGMRYRAHAYHVDFEVYEIVGYNGVSDDAPPIFWEEGAISSMPGTPSMDEAERLMSGSIKWDGCANFTVRDDDACVHLCGVDGWAEMAEMQMRLVETVFPKIEHHDGNELKRIQARRKK